MVSGARGLGLLVVVTALAAGFVVPALPGDAPPQTGTVADGPILRQEGVQVLPGGSRSAVPTGASSVDLTDSRVPSPAAATLAELLGVELFTPDGVDFSAADDEGARQRAWLAAGLLPGAGGPDEGLARTALLDLSTLLLDDGAAVAGWSPRWRYVWPRDAAFVAVALARTGHTDDALEVLHFLQRVQSLDGAFEARYLPDGSGSPDERTAQTDGVGWALWAAGLVVAELDPADRAAAVAGLRSLVVRGATQAAGLVADDGLPDPSPDYWEVAEDEVTLGTAAPLVAGLQQVGPLARLLGDPGLALRADAAAVRAADAVETAFGPSGYGRYAGISQPDAAVAFVQPPFWQRAPAGAADAWRDSVSAMTQPAGGLSPGAGWPADGISWTPETALCAWVAAEAGDEASARAWLAVLSQHRTLRGSLPEKILADGSPASVAPLGWTAALVVLTLDRLDG